MPQSVKADFSAPSIRMFRVRVSRRTRHVFAEIGIVDQDSVQENPPTPKRASNSSAKEHNAGHSPVQGRGVAPYLHDEVQSLLQGQTGPPAEPNTSSRSNALATHRCPDGSSRSQQGKAVGQAVIGGPGYESWVPSNRHRSSRRNAHRNALQPPAESPAPLNFFIAHVVRQAEARLCNVEPGGAEAQVAGAAQSRSGIAVKRGDGIRLHSGLELLPACYVCHQNRTGLLEKISRNS